MKKFREAMSETTVMPRWLWYALVLAAVAFAVMQYVNESRMRDRITAYEHNRLDINVNTERITLIENSLLSSGVLRPEQVRELRERLSQEGQARVTNAGKR